MEQEAEFQPQKQMMIEDLETLRLVSDPLKLQIVDAVQEQAKTVKQIAKELATTPTKLYYHIGPLEERGIVKVVSTRVVSGITEKQYRASARSYMVSRSLLTLSGSQGEEINEALETNILTSIDSFRSEVVKSFRADLVVKHLIQGALYLTEAQVEEVGKKLVAIMEEYDQQTARPDTQKFGMFLALYPTLTPTEAAADEQ